MKRLVFIGCWEEQWRDVILFLEAKGYPNDTIIKHLTEVILNLENSK